MEQQIEYVRQCIQKCTREGYKSIVVKDAVVDSWLKYTDDYFDRTVYSGEQLLIIIENSCFNTRRTHKGIASHGTKTVRQARLRSELYGLAPVCIAMLP